MNKMFENKKAIIFDMDGTLVDSMGVWKNIDIEYLSSLNIPFPENLQKCIEGMCFHDTASYFKNRFGIKASLEEIEKIWNDMAEYKYSHEVKVKDGVERLLKYAKETGLKLGIATSNSRRLTDALLKAKGLDSTFDFVLTGCETLKSKPDPEIYLEASKKLGIEPEYCLVFEDIVPGIMAGKNAGMTVVGVEDYYSEYAREEKKRLSDFYINSYLDIEY